ncbi:hypothetical protein QMG_2248 [Clostridioides difficile DA00256]|nr:hypothetical protein QMG_2248 [Clostridioides difficile DA00256]
MWKKINKKRKHLLLVGAFVLLKLPNSKIGLTDFRTYK